MAPHTVFIVPYRDRQRHRELLEEFLVEDFKVKGWTRGEDVEVFYLHQCDTRPFNRGAMKNIGFLAVRQMFPNEYRDITLVFHDVDSIPCRANMLPYATTRGTVCHYYGYKWALGGMFSIKAGDFERTKGFPNFWGWGLEDNCMNDRCESAGLNMNRDVFFDISDRRIRRPSDGVQRMYSRREANILKREDPDSLLDLNSVQFHLADGGFVNVTSFMTKRNPEEGEFAVHDIRKGGRLKVEGGFFRKNWKMF